MYLTHAAFTADAADPWAAPDPVQDPTSAWAALPAESDPLADVLAAPYDAQVKMQKAMVPKKMM